MLLAMLRWRRPEGRLVAAMACVPQTYFSCDQLPPLLVPVIARACFNEGPAPAWLERQLRRAPRWLAGRAGPGRCRSRGERQRNGGMLRASLLHEAISATDW